MRRALRIFSVSLITAGLVILADVGVTVAWEEPISAAYSSIQQGKAQSDLDAVSEEFAALLGDEETAPPPLDEDPADAGAGQRPEPTGPSAAKVRKEAERLADAFEGQMAIGQAMGKIIAPTISVDQVFANGDDSATLQQGPGHYPDTAIPGQGATIGIAGHRSTYGAPFRHIDRAKRGDEIFLEMPYGNFTYTVQKTEIVQPTELSVVDDVGYERLVLTACHPVYSAAERYVVFARLSEIELPNGQSAALN